MKKRISIASACLLALAFVVLCLMEWLAWGKFSVRYECKLVSVDAEGAITQEYDLDPARCLRGAPEQYFSLGGSASAEAIDGYGYRFLGWSDGQQGTQRTDRPFGNKTVTAYFSYDFGQIPFLFRNGDTLTLESETFSSVTVIKESVKTGYPNYKYPYRFLFPSSVSLLGLGEDSVWQLLPAAADPTLLRDLFALNVASALDFALKPQVKHVVFLDEGKFCGVYLLCRNFLPTDRFSMESGSAENIGIESLDSASYGPEWLEESNLYGLPNHYYKVWKNEKAYLTNFVLPYTYEVVFADGSRERVGRSVDLESAVSAYLINELTKNSVSGERGCLLQYGDGQVSFLCQTEFSHAMGLDRRFASPEGSVYAFEPDMEDEAGEINGFPQYILYGLSRLDWFRALAAERWQALVESGVIEENLALIASLAESDQRLLISDKEAYPFYSVSNEVRVDEWPYYDDAIKSYSYAEHVSALCDWIRARVRFLNEWFGGDA